MTDSTALLRLALKLDAAATAAVGILMAAGAPLIDDAVGAPVAVLVPIGLLLLAYAGAVWLIGTRARISAVAVAAVIVINLLWVAESILTVAVDWLTLTAFGAVAVSAQAAAVLVLAAMQFAGLRRARPARQPA